MTHDFKKKDRSNRYSSKQELCTGVGGYMDYYPNPNLWSKCSVEDFLAYYNSFDKWCLQSCEYLEIQKHIYTYNLYCTTIQHFSIRTEWIILVS